MYILLTLKKAGKYFVFMLQYCFYIHAKGQAVKHSLGFKLEVLENNEWNYFQ